MSSPMAGVAAINSLLFAAYGGALKMISEDEDRPTVGDIFLAGSLSGFINAFFSCPMELVKIRLQTQVTKGKGPIDCVKSIVKSHGITGLYKGLPTTLLRETPSYGSLIGFNIVYFASYELVCRALPDQDPNVPSAGLLLAGGFAGIVGWLTTYPCDVIKTRLQSR